MATVYTDAITAINAANPPIVDKNEYLGTLRHIDVKFVPADNDTLVCSKALPATAKLVSMSIACSALGGSATVDVGYTGTSTSDVILDGVDVSSAALIAYPSTAPGTNGADGEAVDVGGKVLTLTFAGGTYSSETLGGYITIVTSE